MKNWVDVIYGWPLDEWITYVFDFEKATMEANRGQNLCQETTPCKILDENVIKITILKLIQQKNVITQYRHLFTTA